jgi:hypothetical protein
VTSFSGSGGAQAIGLAVCAQPSRLRAGVRQGVADGLGEGAQGEHRVDRPRRVGPVDGGLLVGGRPERQVLVADAALEEKAGVAGFVAERGQVAVAVGEDVPRSREEAGPGAAA